MADGFDQIESAVDEYLTSSYGSARREALLRAGGWDADLAAELADLGWYTLAVPESRDGLGAPLSALGGLFVQAGRHLLVGPLLENLLLPALLHRPGDTAVARVWADTVRTGVPVALVDPGITNDWSRDMGSITLTGTRLDGAHQAVRFGEQAALLAVIATSDSGDEHLCFVDPGQAGVTVTGIPSADPGVALAQVKLIDVDATATAAIGAASTDLVLRVRAWCRLLIACELAGMAQVSVERTVSYLKQREQFGRPLGSFQALKHIAADMHTRAAGLHNLCLASLDDAGVADRVDALDLATLELVAMSAKAYAAETSTRICEDAIQLHGGMGFTTENHISWYYLRALGLRAWYGDEAELYHRIGTTLLGREHPTPGHGRRGDDVHQQHPIQTGQDGEPT